jgi:FKBP-type peptidyl-prolyl cis-trans isomerase 2
LGEELHRSEEGDGEQDRSRYERGDRDGDPHLLIAPLDQRDEVSVRLASHRSGFFGDEPAEISGLALQRNDRDEPIEFPFDGGMVIKGWDIGLSSMKVGGKRRIVIPAELAYGDKDMGDGLIPAASMLVFDVELLEAKQ